MARAFGWIAVVVVLALGGGVLLWQAQTREQLRQQVGELRQQRDQLARLREENQRLAAGLPSATDLERLRADHAAIPRLRAEIEAARERVRATAEAAQLAGRFEPGSKILAADWKNAGTATSKATLETALWAAAGGDIEQFAGCLLVPEGRIRERATTLLESLPAATRQHYSSPEQLVAFLAIRDVPLGSARVVSWEEIQTPSSSVQVQVQLSAPEGATKEVILRFARQGAAWKMVVPEGAIARYAAMLKRPVVTPRK
ncbi:MAG: hypothetical protein HZC55_13615 [Verrucomicrobia bacterium]|nr:hypothetical protein [Verrucomicrobiota bacterium]